MTSIFVLRAFGLGSMCGLRSMGAPAVMRWRDHNPLRLLFAACCVGELIADKLPFTPSRTQPPPLIFRMFVGAACGRHLATDPQDRVIASLAGALGALVGAFAGRGLRETLAVRTGLPDVVVAALEDAVAIGGSVALYRP